MYLTRKGRRGAKALLVISAILFFFGLLLVAGTLGAEEFGYQFSFWSRALRYGGGITSFATAAAIGNWLERLGFFMPCDYSNR